MSADEKGEESACDFSAYEPVRMSHFAKTAAIKILKPKYPWEAVERGVQGQVQVKILVDNEGVVERACATGGDESLRQVAEAVSLQWRFKRNFGFTAERIDSTAKKYVEDFLVYNFVLDKKDAGIGITVTP